MSWSQTIPGIDIDNLHQAIQESNGGLEEGAEVGPGVEEQINAAKEAATALVEHAAVKGERFTLAMSGHSDPATKAHQPTRSLFR